MYMGKLKSYDETTAQIYWQSGELSDSELSNEYGFRYEEYRRMRFDPTIAFARMLCVAPLAMAGWSYEERPGAPVGAKDFISDVMDCHRLRLVKHAIEGYIDYGWCGFEVVPVMHDDKIGIAKIKHLIQNHTEILVNIYSGEYIGMRQNGWSSEDVDLSVYNSLICAFDYEGTYWYGTPLMENVRTTYNDYKIVQAAANRYDHKIAGAFWVVTYPVGSTPYKGVMTNNYDIAVALLDATETSGKIAVPRLVAQSVEDLNAEANGPLDSVWKVELLTDSGRGATSFPDRLKYLDTLKVRAFGIPERAVLEGTFGTKAESEAQADFAIVLQEMRHQIIVDAVNKQTVNNLLTLNYGDDFRDTVYIKPNMLTDDKKAFLRTLYAQLIGDPAVAAGEMPNVDIGAMRESLGIPSTNADDMQSMDEFYRSQQPQVDSMTGLPIDDAAGVIDPAAELTGQQAPQGQVAMAFADGDCGAGGEGGAGFQPGNTCGKSSGGANDSAEGGAKSDKEYAAAKADRKESQARQQKMWLRSRVSADLLDVYANTSDGELRDSIADEMQDRANAGGDPVARAFVTPAHTRGIASLHAMQPASTRRETAPETRSRLGAMSSSDLAKIADRSVNNSTILRDERAMAREIMQNREDKDAIAWQDDQPAFIYGTNEIENESDPDVLDDMLKEETMNNPDSDQIAKIEDRLAVVHEKQANYNGVDYEGPYSEDDVDNADDVNQLEIMLAEHRDNGGSDEREQYIQDRINSLNDEDSSGDEYYDEDGGSRDDYYERTGLMDEDSWNDMLSSQKNLRDAQAVEVEHFNGVDILTNVEPGFADGKVQSPGDLVKWAGAQPGAEMVAGKDAYPPPSSVGDRKGGISIAINHPDYQAQRYYDLDNMVVHNQEIHVHKDKQREGLGSKIFSDQVRESQAAGFKKIETLAARRDGVYNGYKTWPRLGYDVDLESAVGNRMLATLTTKFNLPSVAPTLQDLIATKDGYDWWVENGETTRMTFDLTPGSRSMKVHEAYLKYRADKHKDK